MKGNLKSRLKKSLAGALTGIVAVAMLVPTTVTTFAAEEATAIAGWTIDTTSGTKQYATLQEAYNAVTAGNVDIYPSESAEGTITADLNVSATLPTGVTEIRIHADGIDLDLDVTGDVEGTAEGNCISDGTSGIYTVTKHQITDVVIGWNFEKSEARIIASCDNCGTGELDAESSKIEYAPKPSCTEAGVAKVSVDLGDLGTQTKTFDLPALGHDYVYVDDSLEFVKDETTGLIEYDSNGDPIATAKVACSRADECEFTPVSVTPIVVKKNVITEATCQNYGETEYTYNIVYNGNTITKDEAGDTISLVLSNQTEKVGHISKVDKDDKIIPVSTGAVDGKTNEYVGKIEYYTGDDENPWSENLNDAEIGTDGIIKYRTYTYCEFEYDDTVAAVNQSEGVTLIPSETKEWAPAKDAQEYVCTDHIFTYDPIYAVYTDPYLNSTEQQDQCEVQYVIEGTIEVPSEVPHTLDENRKIVKIIDATCYMEGYNKGYCTVCGQEDSIAEVAQLTDAHTLGAKVTVAPSCVKKGATYQVCSECAEHIGNIESEVKDLLQASRTAGNITEDEYNEILARYDFTALYKAATQVTADEYNVEADILGSYIVEETPATGHDYKVVKASDVKFYPGLIVTDSEGNVINKRADTNTELSANSDIERYLNIEPIIFGDYTYSVTFFAISDVVCANEGIDNVVKDMMFDVKAEVTEAADDCTEQDVVTLTAYNEKGEVLTDMAETPNAVTLDVLGNHGDHNYAYEINWSRYGDAAYITMECTNGTTAAPCSEENAIHLLKCDITRTENADGTSTYTAVSAKGVDTVITIDDLSALGDKLTGDLTYTVYDLSKAKVTVDEKYIDTDTLNALIKAGTVNTKIEDYLTISVEINDAEIDRDAYEIQAEEAVTGSKVTLNIIPSTSLKDKNEWEDYLYDGIPVIRSISNKTVEAADFSYFTDLTYEFDDEELDEYDLEDGVSLSYDSEDHEFVVSTNVDDAEVTYFVTAAGTKNVKSEKCTEESAEIRDAGSYDIYYLVSADKYFDTFGKITVTISKKTLNITIGDSNSAVTELANKVYRSFTKIYDNDAENEVIPAPQVSGIIDGDDVTVDLSEHGEEAGQYRVIPVLSGDDADNYVFYVDEDNGTNQVLLTISKRSASVVVNNVTINAGDDVAAAIKDAYVLDDNVIDGDDLGVVVKAPAGIDNTVAGTYDLTATANNKNYDVTVVNGILTIKTTADTKIYTEAELQEKLAEQAKEMQATIDELTAQKAELQNELDEAKEDVAENEEIIKILNTQIESLDAQIATLNEDKTALQEANTKLSTDLQTAQETLAKTESDLKAAQAAQAQAETTLKATQETLTQTQKQLQEAEKKAAEGKVANTMTVKAKTVKAKAKKATKIKKAKAFKVAKAKGAVKFAKLKGNAKITVTAKGVVKVKKGLKKGKTYKVKVLVTAAGKGNYAPAVKTVTLKVKIK